MYFKTRLLPLRRQLQLPGLLNLRKRGFVLPTVFAGKRFRVGYLSNGRQPEAKKEIGANQLHQTAITGALLSLGKVAHPPKGEKMVIVQAVASTIHQLPLSALPRQQVNVLKVPMQKVAMIRTTTMAGSQPALKRSRIGVVGRGDATGWHSSRSLSVQSPKGVHDVGFRSIISEDMQPAIPGEGLARVGKVRRIWHRGARQEILFSRLVLPLKKGGEIVSKQKNAMNQTGGKRISILPQSSGPVTQKGIDGDHAIVWPALFRISKKEIPEPERVIREYMHRASMGHKADSGIRSNNSNDTYSPIHFHHNRLRNGSNNGHVQDGSHRPAIDEMKQVVEEVLIDILNSANAID